MDTNILYKTFPVFFQEAPEGGYVVFVPTLPGCHSQGDSLEEAEENIKEAIEVYLESLQDSGEYSSQESRILQGSVKVPLPA